mgnify:CR=1 FL=1
MKLSKICEEIEYTLLQGSLETEVRDIIYDSRKIAPETMFVCMVGAVTDGHKYIPDAVEKEASVIVLEKEEEAAQIPENITVLKVESARLALALMSAALFDHPARKLVTIGLTGTKGKTTTTYMIKKVLEMAGKKVGLIGTIGAMIGEEHLPSKNTTPESYELHRMFAAMVEAGCEYVVMEVSSQGVKMHRVDGILFDYGIFTNISPDHIGPDEHKDFEEYLYYKTRLLDSCRIGLLNGADPHAEAIKKEVSCKLYTYNAGKESKVPDDFMAENIRYLAEPDFVGTQFHVSGRCEMEIRLGIPGLFNVENAMAAVSLCSLLGLDPQTVSHALEHIRVNGRMEIVHTSSHCTVLVDYAHNAVSMESLLKTLRDYSPKRLVCVFGCGGNRSKDRRYSMGEIGGRLADLCILTADNSRYEKVEDILADIRGSIEKTGGAFMEIPDRREAIRYSVFHAEPGDMIAVIGKGHEDYQEINGVRHHFLDREVIEEAVRELREKEQG